MMSSSTYPLARPVYLRDRDFRGLVYRPGWKAAAFFAAHVPLALLAHQFELIATLHALITIGVGLWWAASSNSRRLDRVAYVVAYIVGAEVLWRMADARVFWEVGKYATVAIFVVAMIKNRRLRGPISILAYFLLLLPSAVLTFMQEDLLWFTLHLRFNLSGPLALLASAWFFSNLKLSAGQLQRLFIALIAPTISIAVITLFMTVTAASIKFVDESNHATSGGFGPNQVSTALGFGALLALFCALNRKSSKWFRALMFCAMTFLAVQSALTFSRGGLYTAAGAAVAAFFYLSRDPHSRLSLIIVSVFLFVMVSYVVLPRLNAFTGGALSTRFQNTDLTGRANLVEGDLDLWAENPILGVGPGQAMSYRKSGKRWSAAHTEFSRLLAEHGAFGLAALLLFLVSGARNLRRARGFKSKAMTAAMMGWSCLYMLNAAMRLAAPAFAFGLSFATLLPEENAKRRPVRRRQPSPSVRGHAGAVGGRHWKVARG
jgi:hypothetical protein